MASTLITTLAARGFIQDVTPGLEARLSTGAPITAYAGFDPTASSLHVGNLVPVLGLAWLQRLGGRPIVLVGGGTGLVGDPSGKRTERLLKDEAEIEANATAIAAQLARFVRFEGPSAAKMVNNADWLRDLPLMHFLRDTGKHFTVNYMLQKDSVKSRMETGISFTEFTYMLVQAHDFRHLLRAEGCELQMGGSDQWGNITAGIELISRSEQRDAHGLVFPLLTTATGAKFGKSESGNIWLDPSRTSPYEFYQFWLNTDDRDVERFLKLFTFVELSRIERVMTEQHADPGRRAAQRLLAEEVTRLVHGDAETEKALAAARAIFGGAAAAGDDDYAALATTMPHCAFTREELAAGLPVVDALVRAGLATSKADARRGIQGKGFSVNREVIESPDRRLEAGDLRAERYVLLQKGKKNFVMGVVGA